MEVYDYSDLNQSGMKNGEVKALCEELDRWRKLATQRGARMQILRRWLCLEACDGTEDSLDEVWQSFVWSNSDAEAWFNADGVPVDE